MTMKLFAFISLFLASHFLVAGQNINPELSKKYTMEVYKGSDYASTIHIEENKAILKRVQVKEMDPNSDDVRGYIALSTIEMVDKYNKINRDDASNFQAKTFNPLKYRFNFYNKHNQREVYRVDFTNYFIIIEPRK